MSDLRCKKCRQLQFKYFVRGNQLIIETKCYACNTFNYLHIQLNQLNKLLQKHETSDQHK